jgi:hypothetical protein
MRAVQAFCQRHDPTFPALIFASLVAVEGGDGDGLLQSHQ